MRSYPRNSPEAAARIVALVLISDGHVCRSEIEALQQRQVEPELGLAPGAFAQVVHTLCEDVLMGGYGGGSMMCSVDDTTLALLLAEVDEPALRAKVLMLAGVAVEADKHLAEGEAQLVAAMRRQWCRADHEPTARPVVQALQPA